MTSQKPVEIFLVETARIDYEALSSTLREGFGDVPNMKVTGTDFMKPILYQWKYKSPFGLAKVAHVREGERIVATLAMYPLEAIHGDRHLIAWQAADLTTLKHARGGVITRRS